MARFLIPIILLGAALGLFILYTNPTYQATKGISSEVASYDEALNKSQELKSVRDKLISKRNTFAPEDVAKLTKILPDNVDNIRFIIDINNIASRHNLSLKNVQLGSVSDSKTARNALSGGFQGQVSDIERHAEDIIKMKRRLNEVYVKHTKRAYDVIEKTLDRDYFMSAEQAQEFGLIDKVLEKRDEAEGLLAGGKLS